MSILMKHIEEEESPNLKEFRSVVSDSDLEKLGRLFREKRAAAPTHPHPMAPDSHPTLETAAGMMAKPIDKMRDIPREFAKRNVPE